MNKNAQILIGVGILSLGGFLYWKSTQTPKVNATGDGDYVDTDTNCYNAKGNVVPCPKPKKATKAKKQNFGGGIKAVPQDFFKTQGSVDAINNFKNADGFTETSTQPVFAHADGYTKTAKSQAFANANGGILGMFKHKPNGFTNTRKHKVFANAAGGFEASAPSQVFANMIPTMATHNSGNSFM